MTKRLQKHASTLKLLHKAKPSLQKAILTNSSEDLIKCICDCALNILRGNLPVSKITKTNLTKYKRSLRRLADPKVSVITKRKAIQRGGFLGTLLSAVLPAISSVITSLTSKS